MLHLPAIAIAYVHVFDQPHDMSAAAEVLQHIQHRMIIHTALHDDVDLDRRQAGLLCRLNTLEDTGQFATVAAHAPEYILVHTVETDGYAVQARICE